MTEKLDKLEEELSELERIIVGSEPSDEYQMGFRDGVQHAISVARGVLDES